MKIIKATLTIILIFFCCAQISLARASASSLDQDLLSYSAKVVRKPKANPVQFFNLGVVEEDVYINKIQLKLGPSLAYFFATVRLSLLPVEKFGDQETSGWYFTGNPPLQMGTLHTWRPNSVQKTSIFDGGGFLLKKGTYLVFEIFFSETSETNSDLVDLKLYKSKSSPKNLKKKRYFNRFEKSDFVIPALVDFFELTQEHTLAEDIQLVTLKPTLHLRGVSAVMGYTKSEVEGPKVLFNIPNYSIYNYKGYRFKKPINLKKGTKLWIRGVYNNSFGNIFNPNPLVKVNHGWKIEDEILRFSYQYYKK